MTAITSRAQLDRAIDQFADQSTDQDWTAHLQELIRTVKSIDGLEVTNSDHQPVHPQEVLNNDDNYDLLVVDWPDQKQWTIPEFIYFLTHANAPTQLISPLMLKKNPPVDYESKYPPVIEQSNSQQAEQSQENTIDAILDTVADPSEPTESRVEQFRLLVNLLPWTQLNQAIQDHSPILPNIQPRLAFTRIMPSAVGQARGTSTKFYHTYEGLPRLQLQHYIEDQKGVVDDNARVFQTYLNTMEALPMDFDPDENWTVLKEIEQQLVQSKRVDRFDGVEFAKMTGKQLHLIMSTEAQQEAQLDNNKVYSIHFTVGKIGSYRIPMVMMRINVNERVLFQNLQQDPSWFAFQLHFFQDRLRRGEVLHEYQSDQLLV